MLPVGLTCVCGSSCQAGPEEASAPRAGLHCSEEWLYGFCPLEGSIYLVERTRAPGQTSVPASILFRRFPTPLVDLYGIYQCILMYWGLRSQMSGVVTDVMFLFLTLLVAFV